VNGSGLGGGRGSSGVCDGSSAFQQTASEGSKQCLLEGRPKAADKSKLRAKVQTDCTVAPNQGVNCNECLIDASSVRATK
jgi:hypothetical protein